MRSEQAMLDLILRTAREDQRIRAVMMNGSRANPGAPRDLFQDYDIVYVVTDLTPFICNGEWIQRFGEIMVMQMPDTMGEPEPTQYTSFAYLMQFMDGNRIDLTFIPVTALERLKDDSQSILLLDKDRRIKAFPPASDDSYLPQPPTPRAFAHCCNEFWWVSPYVAKGLWRDELPYARSILEQTLREQLYAVLVWHIGAQTDFAVSPGKLGKYLQRFLEPAWWNLWLQTCAGPTIDAHWDALEAMCTLFRTAARAVAEHFAFDYPQGDDDRVSAHLHHVRQLPRDAEAIYP